MKGPEAPFQKRDAAEVAPDMLLGHDAQLTLWQQVLNDRWLLFALAAVVLVLVTLAVSLPRRWTSTPKGVAPAIKVSLFGRLQAWSHDERHVGLAGVDSAPLDSHLATVPKTGYLGCVSAKAGGTNRSRLAERLRNGSFSPPQRQRLEQTYAKLVEPSGKKPQRLFSAIRLS
jgi:hypothetical protein